MNTGELPITQEGWIIWIRYILDQIESGKLTITEARHRLYAIQNPRKVDDLMLSQLGKSMRDGYGPKSVEELIDDFS